MHRSFLAATVLLAASLPAQSTWWVSPTGSDGAAGTSAGTAFQTVNHAATIAAAGDVIRLVAGTFGDEQGNILLGTKALTVVGAGVGQTIVKANSTADISLPAGLLPGTNEAHRPAITLQGTARVDLRDMTLDQGFFMPSTGRGYCLWVGGGADTVIDNVDFKNARANPINGIQGPLAVNIRGDGVGDTTNVTLRHCTVREYGKGGVVANFDAHLVMDDCTVDGYGHANSPLAAQNAIQVSRGATCELRRTQVTNSWYEPASVVATGVLLFDPGSSVVIEDCDFGDCQVGIYTFHSAQTTITGSIRRNVVHGSAFAIYVANTSGLVIQENSFAVALAGDANDAQDDSTPANTWLGNRYSSATAAGPHALPGTGGAIDPAGLAGCGEFGPAAATALPGGLAPVDMVVTDLDGDGDPDFATLCQGASAPALALGSNGGGGAFATSSLSFGVAAGLPVALVAGQFDGAPGIDLAAVTINVPPTLTENKVYVFANNGLGSFSLLHTHTLIGFVSPSGVAAGDVDGDGRADLVVTDAGSGSLIAGGATVLRNNGSGTAFAASALPGAFTAACRGAAIAALDAGATADVAVSEGDAGSGRVHLFAGDGLGGFAVLGSPVATNANTNDVLAADLDGDGDTDLLVSASRDAFSLDTGSVQVLDNDGAAAFLVSQYRVDRGPTRLAAGDVGKDADPDTLRRDAAVVDLAAGSVTLLGQYLAGKGFGTGGICATGTGATDVALADVDGNGYQDLLWCDALSGTVSVALATVQARVDFYGAGCAGTKGRVPFLTAVGLPALPTLPNATFGLSLTNARPLTIGVIGLGTGALPIAPCTLLIDNLVTSWLVLTSVAGSASQPLPVPATPAFLGAELYLQAGVFDADALDSFLPGISLSQGLKIRLGD